MSSSSSTSHLEPEPLIATSCNDDNNNHTNHHPHVSLLANPNDGIIAESTTIINTNNNNNNNKDYHSLSMAYQTYLRHDTAEQNHWDEVCHAYRQYATFAMAQWKNMNQRLQNLPPSQRMVLSLALRNSTTLEYQQRAQQYHEAAIRNQFCLDCILRHAGVPHSQQVAKTTKSSTMVSDTQLSRVSSVLKSLARDWSSDGQAERDMTYQPILEEMLAYMPPTTTTTSTTSKKKNHVVSSSTKVSSSSTSTNRLKDNNKTKNNHHNNDDHGDRAVRRNSRAYAPKVCVPGAGVGRLAFELYKMGYRVQGNEFSLYMLLASDFILNASVATPERPLSISPWLLESRNVHSSQDPVRVVTIPDVDPYTVLSNTTTTSHDDNNNEEDHDIKNTTRKQKMETSDHPRNDFTMAAGDFAMIYSHPRERGQWDAVVCCFFLDAAPSIIEYIQIIHRMLRPGGILMNFGPLLYHWSGPAMRPDDASYDDYQARFSYLDPRYMNSVDLSWEDVREVLMNVGFDILEENPGQRALYTADRKSMMNLGYRCINFVARKATTTAQQQQQRRRNANDINNDDYDDDDDDNNSSNHIHRGIFDSVSDSDDGGGGDEDDDDLDDMEDNEDDDGGGGGDDDEDDMEDME